MNIHSNSFQFAPNVIQHFRVTYRFFPARLLATIYVDS